MTLDEICNLPPQEAIDALDGYIAAHPEDDEALTLRGMRRWALSRRSEAIKDYLAAIRINPDSRARLALEQANRILDFFHPDLLNP